MIDAAGKQVRTALPCGCIYDPNSEKSGPGSGSIAVQGDCQIIGAAWAVHQQDATARANGNAMFQRHQEFRKGLGCPEPGIVK